MYRTISQIQTQKQHVSYRFASPREINARPKWSELRLGVSYISTENRYVLETQGPVSDPVSVFGFDFTSTPNVLGEASQCMNKPYFKFKKYIKKSYLDKKHSRSFTCFFG